MGYTSILSDLVAGMVVQQVNSGIGTTTRVVTYHDVTLDPTRTIYFADGTSFTYDNGAVGPTLIFNVISTLN